jgi:hypothetical protein
MRLIDRVLPVGPRSILFGSHQFLVHPLMVIWAWKKLYGEWPDFRETVCIFLHDLGYVTQWCHDMDGAEGDTHPEWAATVAGRWFGPEYAALRRYHSRFLARRDGRNVSRLCAPDKLAGGSWPVWLFVLLGRLSGEIDEYMARSVPGSGEKYVTMGPQLRYSPDRAEWYREVCAHLRAWAWEHRDGRYDTWTQGAQRSAEA